MVFNETRFSMGSTLALAKPLYCKTIRLIGKYLVLVRPDGQKIKFIDYDMETIFLKFTGKI